MTLPNGKTLGLALSGGGFRGTLFNLGGLWRINDAGWMQGLDRVTSVSGGSILAGLMAKRWSELNFSGGTAQDFEAELVAPIRRFCSKGIDVRDGVLGLINPFRSTGETLEKTYNDALFDDFDLQMIADDAPRFIFYATNYQTGVSFRFSKPYMADYHLGLFDQPRVPLAKVVAASAAFPPVLSPVTLETDPTHWRDGDETLPLNELRKKIVLTDGGVYDNMGLESLWDHDEIDTVVVSDAGGPFSIQNNQRAFWLNQLPRVRNILIEQTRALRKRMMVDQYQSGRKAGALWTIQTQIADFQLQDPLMPDSPATQKLRDVRTRLNKFENDEQDALINWGYALADAALRKYVEPQLQRGDLPYRSH